MNDKIFHGFISLCGFFFLLIGLTHLEIPIMGLIAGIGAFIQGWYVQQGVEHQLLLIDHAKYHNEKNKSR